MAVAYRGANNAAGESAGTTTTASTVSITPTLPASTASGDRVFIIECGSNTSGTAPTNWTVALAKDTVVGTGAVSAGAGQRYMSVYYRDYDGVWTMPALTLTSAAQNSHWVGAISLSKGGTEVWGTPMVSTVGTDYGTANTSASATTGSIMTHAGGFVIIGTVQNDNVTTTSPALSQSGATFGAVTERCDGGTATGNDVSGSVHTCSVTTGATAALTFTATLSAASEGGTVVIEQTAAVPGAKTATVTDDFASYNSTKWAYQLGNATVTGGQLQVVLPTTATYDNFLSTGDVTFYDLTSSSVMVELVQAPNASAPSAQVYFMVTDQPYLTAATNYEAFQVGDGGNVTFKELVAGVADSTNIAYSSTNHRWLRLRESGGTIFWDTSPDGVTWTNRRSKTAKLTLTNICIGFMGGCYASEATPGTAILDNVNLSTSGNFFAMMF